MLKPLPATLPDKDGATVVQQRHPRIFLISFARSIHTKGNLHAC